MTGLSIKGRHQSHLTTPRAGFFCFWCTLFTVVSLLSSPAFAQRRVEHEIPELTVLLAHAEPVRIQQQIIQRVRLVSRYNFDSLDVQLGTNDNIEIVSLETANTRPFEGWGVEGFVYSLSRAIFPQKSGALTIPAVTISGVVTDDDGKPIRFELASEARDFDIQPVSQAMFEAPWLVASDVSFTESWSTPPHELKMGELAQRTITAVVHGALAEQISAPEMPVGTGIQVLKGATTRSNAFTPSGVVGTLNQVFDVRVASDYLSDISPVRLIWWNANEQKVERSAVRGWRIEPILPNRDEVVTTLISQAELDQSKSQSALTMIGLPLIAALVLLALIWRLVPVVRKTLGRLINRLADKLLGPESRLPDIGFSRIQRPRPEDRS